MGHAESRKNIARLLTLGALLVAVAAPALAADAFKLRSGARGKLCLGCHDTFAETLNKPFVHTPIAKGDCSGCHNPHTSDHETLLTAESSVMCQSCHDDLVPSEMTSVHQVFIEGSCASCHDPHAADNKMNLVRAGSALCFECHADLGESIEANQVAHDPVRKDCLGCHNPHVSTASDALLKKSEPSLCLQCHSPDKPAFKTRHKDYPVAKARCTSCHNPHGSNTAGILYDNVHPPVLENKCHECHEGPSSSAPFALKDSGFELCEGCHYEEVADIFNKSSVHWPVVDKQGCINCHAPHASSEDGLLKEPMLDLCGACHADTVARQERAQTKHPPVADGECAACHSPHSSDNLFLANQDSQVELCATCHDWQSHSSHPIGEEIVDPRNPNVAVTCESCHRSHGTEFQHFIYFETTNEMCIQCHDEYRR